jgi:hypothetical protein
VKQESPRKPRRADMGGEISPTNTQDARKGPLLVTNRRRNLAGMAFSDEVPNRLK